MMLTLLQTMRVDATFADVTVIGSQYEDEMGTRQWHLAVWSESYAKVRRYRISEDRKPEELIGAYREAAEQAMARWEAQPVWVE
jgi:hypothetical protein